MLLSNGSRERLALSMSVWMLFVSCTLHTEALNDCANMFEVFLCSLMRLLRLLGELCVLGKAPLFAE